MDPQLVRAFCTQVTTQCHFLLIASAQINAGLLQLDATGREGTMEVFAGIQAVLTAAANISKALWGPRGSLAVERKPLRDALEVLDDSPLSETAMRNNFDHFDDRLDTWWKQSAHHNYLDLNMGSMKQVESFAEIDRFRSFDRNTMEVEFWGRRFNIQALVREAQQIVSKPRP